jgi:hypothetical protein
MGVENSKEDKQSVSRPQGAPRQDVASPQSDSHYDHYEWPEEDELGDGPQSSEADHYDASAGVASSGRILEAAMAGLSLDEDASGSSPGSYLVAIPQACPFTFGRVRTCPTADSSITQPHEVRSQAAQDILQSLAHIPIKLAAAALNKLPVEVIQQISRYLHPVEIVSLIHACKSIYNVIGTNITYKLEIKHPHLTFIPGTVEMLDTEWWTPVTLRVDTMIVNSYLLIKWSYTFDFLKDGFLHDLHSLEGADIEICGHVHVQRRNEPWFDNTLANQVLNEGPDHSLAARRGRRCSCCSFDDDRFGPLGEPEPSQWLRLRQCAFCVTEYEVDVCRAESKIVVTAWHNAGKFASFLSGTINPHWEALVGKPGSSPHEVRVTFYPMGSVKTAFETGDGSGLGDPCFHWELYCL